MLPQSPQLEWHKFRLFLLSHYTVPQPQPQRSPLMPPPQFEKMSQMTPKRLPLFASLTLRRHLPLPHFENLLPLLPKQWPQLHLLPLPLRLPRLPPHRLKW